MIPRSVAVGLLAVSCGEPAALVGGDASIFQAGALEAFDEADRSYVAGHATGVYLYSIVLPRFVAGTRFTYEPGRSSPEAAVPYDFSRVVSALSYGADECYTREDGTIACPPGQEAPAPDPADDPDDEPDDEPDPDDPDWLDDDCETFLDPAAMDARDAADRMPLPEGMDEDYHRGLADALHLEDLDEETDYSEPEHLKDVVQDAGLCDHSPLILDLDGDGIEMSAARNGVLFDLLARGSPVMTAWPSKADPFLVLDGDGDGAITHGGEMFGTSTKISGRTFDNGFLALARFDDCGHGGNHDGAIDADDEVYARLRLWSDSNWNGLSEPDELTTLAAAGVQSIALAHAHRSTKDAHDNRLEYWGTFSRNVSDRVLELPVVDVWLKIRAVAPRFMN